MRRNLLAVFLAFVSLLGSAASILAHHSASATYDMSKTVTLTGTVTKLEWKNPHVFYYIDVVDSTGKTVNWAIEASTPNQLYRAGWRKKDLPPGTPITLKDTSPARNGSSRASGGTVTLPDGRKIFSGSVAEEK
jgi:hypothetical protein